jgi:hypothetical protein
VPEIFSGLPDQEGDSVVVADRQRHVVIPDPELLLPDDRIPRLRALVARSMWLGGTFMSVSAYIEKRKQMEARMNENVLDWQRDIMPPCYLQYGVKDPDTGEELFIYGEIPDIQAFVEDEAKAAGRIGPEREKFARRLTRRMEDALKRGWLYGQWYSRTNVLGEWGSIHRSVIQEVLSEAKYRELEAKLWD